MTTVARAGRARGSATCQKTPNAPQPSMRAASSRSGGEFLEGRAQDEDADGEGKADVGADEGEVCVFQVEGAGPEEAVEGDEGDVRRDDHSGEEEEEERLASAESHAGEGEAGGRRGGGGEGDGDPGDDEAVHVGSPEPARCKDGGVAFDGGVQREGKGGLAKVAFGAERTEGHPEEGIAGEDEDEG